MIQIKNLTVRNFMSVGNATQGIDFDRSDLTLVLGENLDLGGDGSRNGTGKTTIINALSYALYGNALSNIRKDNLVNKTNGKNMLVSLDFSVNGKQYKIERGRKPNVLKFFVNDEEQSAEDNAQGDSRETQDAIERTLGLSHDMFKHILALNTYTEPFLSLKANDQRTIIEQLLGITMLSERADRIKEINKETKDAITQEEFRIRAVQEANKRIEEQIESLKRRQGLWVTKHEEETTKIEAALSRRSTLKRRLMHTERILLGIKNAKISMNYRALLAELKLTPTGKLKPLSNWRKRLRRLSLTPVTHAVKRSTTRSTNRSWKVSRKIWQHRERQAKSIHNSYQTYRLPSKPWAC